MFLTTVKQVKLEVRPLFLPQLVQLTSMLKPGLHSICVINFISSLIIVHILKLIKIHYFLHTYFAFEPNTQNTTYDSGPILNGWNFMNDAKKLYKHLIF